MLTTSSALWKSNISDHSRLSQSHSKNGKYLKQLTFLDKGSNHRFSEFSQAFLRNNSYCRKYFLPFFAWHFITVFKALLKNRNEKLLFLNPLFPTVISEDQRHKYRFFIVFFSFTLRTDRQDVDHCSQYNFDQHLIAVISGWNLEDLHALEKS